MRPLVARHAAVDGITLSWHERSGHDRNAPTIVFLHGLGASSRDFWWLAHHPALALKRLLAIDAIGHGGSEGPPGAPCTIEQHAALVAALLQEISPSPVTLVGHSMGGSMAILVACRHATLVARLVVAEPHLDPGVGTFSGHIARQSEERFAARGYPALVYQTERAAVRGDTVAAGFLPSLREASPIVMHRSAVSLRAERSPTFREHLLAARMPRMMLWGDRTPPLSPPLVSTAVRQVTIPAAGHHMMLDNPDGFAGAIRDAIDTGPAGDPPCG
jgi:pimeloyl-ACP methyl ester carboxylesterase